MNNDPPNVEQPTNSCCGAGASCASKGWRLPVLLLVVLAAVVAARTSRYRERGPIPGDEESPPAAVPSDKTVSLTIRFDNGKEQKYDAVPWRPGMTVDDLLTAVSRQPGGITYVVYGDHEMTLLSRINDSRSEGAGGRNWTYSVNDVRADRSLAVYELQPGDRVLWEYGLEE
jgi:Domain of unknown function (DUF4430)